VGHASRANRRVGKFSCSAFVFLFINSPLAHINHASKSVSLSSNHIGSISNDSLYNSENNPATPQSHQRARLEPRLEQQPQRIQPPVAVKELRPTLKMRLPRSESNICSSCREHISIELTFLAFRRNRDVDDSDAIEVSDAPCDYCCRAVLFILSTNSLFIQRNGLGREGRRRRSRKKWRRKRL
jgi:hypothetical protein